MVGPAEKDLFWRLFELTGSPYAYNEYRRLRLSEEQDLSDL